MPSYWWECEQCGSRASFLEASATKAIAHFIWDRLLPSGWDQSYLTLKCQGCGQSSVRITYDFPRADKETVRVVHIVGRVPGPGGVYLPIMWETYPLSAPEDRWFDFKYLNGRSPWGLDKAAVFSRADLSTIFTLYRDRTGVELLPAAQAG